MAGKRVSTAAIALALLTASCQAGPTGTGAIPQDPLGVIERLGADESTLGWQACSIRVMDEFEFVERTAAAGQFSLETGDAIAAELLASGVKTAVTDGSEALSLLPGSFGSFGWSDSLGQTAVSAADLIDPETAARLLGAQDSSPVELTDEAGRSYLHYEVLPSIGWPREQEDGSWPATALVQAHQFTTAYAIDIWPDEAGRTERLRLRSQELRRIWAELRFLPGHDDGGRPAVPECPQELAESSTEVWAGFQPWDQKLRVPLEIALDPDGRPYDVVPADGVTIRHEPFGTLFSGDGTVVVMDGNALEVDMIFFNEGNPIVDFGEATELDMTVVWEVRDDWEDFLGIRLQRPGTEVSEWLDLEFAYGTDGGVGAFTTGTIMFEAARRGDESLSELAMTLANEGFPGPVLMDLDGVDGIDSAYFNNGWGDGAFPMSRGIDASGDTVALYIFDLRYPWRLMVPDGRPPPNVTAREQEYIECLEGTREVRADGQCPADEDAF